MQAVLRYLPKEYYQLYFQEKIVAESQPKSKDTEIL